MDILGCVRHKGIPASPLPGRRWLNSHVCFSSGLHCQLWLHMLLSTYWKQNPRAVLRSLMFHFQSVNVHFLPWYIYIYIFFFFFSFFIATPEVPRPGVESELQLSACATATATPDLSHIFNLYSSLRQSLLLNPLGKARDPTRILMDTSWVLHSLNHSGNSSYLDFNLILTSSWSLTPSQNLFGEEGRYCYGS